MRKPFLHTGFWNRPWLFSLMVMMVVQVSGQNTDTASTKDTVIQEYAIVEGKLTTTHFEPVSQEAQLPIRHREVDTSALIKLKNDKAFWYINEAPKKEVKKEQVPPPKKFESQTWLRNLLWFLVVGGFVVIIIWFLLASDIRLFRKPSMPVGSGEEVETLNTENLFDLDYNREIRKAIAAQNFRLAIRLLYLQTLKEMALREIIRFRQGRTNSDYLMQLFGTSYYKDFFRLTRSFEYAWYGRFEVSPQAFDLLQAEFSSFNQKLQS